MRIFRIDGPPVGYYTSGGTPNYTRLNKYVAWKKLVQKTAMTHGITLPLVATKEKPMFIETYAVFHNGTHPDPENVHKGIVDALFYDPSRKKKGAGDKHTGGMFHPPFYEKGNPHVVVRFKSNDGPSLFLRHPKVDTKAFWVNEPRRLTE